MKSFMWKAYVDDKPITFSYTKKYWVNYGMNLVEGLGSYAGKLYGVGWSQGDKYFVVIVIGAKHFNVMLDDITEYALASPIDAKLKL